MIRKRRKYQSIISVQDFTERRKNQDFTKRRKQKKESNTQSVESLTLKKNVEENPLEEVNPVEDRSVTEEHSSDASALEKSRIYSSDGKIEDNICNFKSIFFLIIILLPLTGGLLFYFQEQQTDDQVAELPLDTQTTPNQTHSPLPSLKPTSTPSSWQQTETPSATPVWQGRQFADLPCETIKEQLSSMEPSNANALRRELQRFQPKCFSDLFETLKQMFLNRIEQMHLNLHLPKAGGTSLCNLLQAKDFRVPHNNCWAEFYCPIWCCCDTFQARPCEKFSSLKYNFIMNERFLDYYGSSPFCPSLFYSINIREPISRTMSHMNHAVSIEKFAKHMTIESWHFIEHNYFTWSLLAGNHSSPLRFAPKMKDLPNAKLVLSGFDFILDLHNEECNSNFFWLMGMEKNVTLPHDNFRKENYKRHFSGELDDLRQSNLVDTKLYELGEDLTRLDCEFISRVVRGHSSRPQYVPTFADVPIIRRNPAKIIFLKTHKTASSTITAMLHYYCDNYDKNCFLFHDKSQSGVMSDFRKSKVIKHLQKQCTTKDSSSIDVWSNHVIFHENLFKFVGGAAQGQLFSIVRHPVSRWKSAMNWYKISPLTRGHRSMHEYANYLQREGKDKTKTHLNVNGMCKEFGLEIGSEFSNSPRDFSNTPAFQKVQSGEWLLLVTERMEESLTVWTYAYQLPPLPIPEKMKSNPHHEDDTFTHRDESFIESISDCDMQLYNLALKMLDLWKSRIPDFEAKLAYMKKYWKKMEKTKVLDNIPWNGKHAKTCFPLNAHLP